MRLHNLLSQQLNLLISGRASEEQQYLCCTPVLPKVSPELWCCHGSTWEMPGILEQVFLASSYTSENLNLPTHTSCPQSCHVITLLVNECLCLLRGSAAPHSKFLRTLGWALYKCDDNGFLDYRVSFLRLFHVAFQFFKPAVLII